MFQGGDREGSFASFIFFYPLAPCLQNSIHFLNMVDEHFGTADFQLNRVPNFEVVRHYFLRKDRMIDQELSEYKEFKVGDIVHLRCGSPDLRVIRTEGLVEVEWQNDGNSVRGVFSATSLQAAILAFTSSNSTISETSQT